MNRILRLTVALPVVTFLFVTSADAKEPDSYYWRGGIGYVYMPDAHWKDPYAEGDISFDGGPGLDLAFGISPGFVPLRVEVAWVYQANGISEVSSDQPVINPVDWATVSMSAFMVNGYIDIRNRTRFTPYLMAGIGEGYYGIELEEDNTGSDRVTVYQGGIGIQYVTDSPARLKYNVVIDLGYRFTSSSNPEINEALGGVYETEYTAHAIMFSIELRHVFNRSPDQE